MDVPYLSEAVGGSGGLKSAHTCATKPLRMQRYFAVTILIHVLKKIFSSKYSDVLRSPHWMRFVSVHRGPLRNFAAKLLLFFDICK